MREQIVPVIFADIIARGDGELEIDAFCKAVMYIIEIGKAKYLKHFSEEFTRLTNEGFNQMPVTVTTSFELNKEQQLAVAETLAEKRYADCKPAITFRVNPRIMGGLNVNWGGEQEYSQDLNDWFEHGMDGMRRVSPKELAEQTSASAEKTSASA